MIEIIIGAILIAFGIISIFYTAEEDWNDKQAFIVLSVSILFIMIGGWLIITSLGLLILILIKLIGLIILGIGIFLAGFFPDVSGRYQPTEFAHTGVFIGIIMVIVGIYMVFLMW